MRVLILSQHFTPEVTAASARVHAFAAGLAARGHAVQVVCEVPSHPEGVVRPGYERRFRARRAMDGFEVDYVWVRTSPGKGLRDRALLYGSYAASAAALGAVARRPDVVLVSSPPLPAAAAAAFTALRHRVPWVMDVRDPWPEAAVILGELTDPRLIRPLELLERRLYASAALVTTVTDGFRDEIAAKVDDSAKVTVIMNGTTGEWLRAGASEPDRAGVGFPGEATFVWAYAGNVGLAQDLETAVDAARELGEGFRLVILGAGPRLAAVRARAAAIGSGSVEFREPVPAGEAARILRAADASLVSLAAEPGLHKFLPSKLFDCCAVARPMIVTAPEGAATRLAQEWEAGISVEPEDPRGLADAVRRLRENEDLRRRLAAGARRLAEEHLREHQVERLEDVLRSALDRGAV